MAGITPACTGIMHKYTVLPLHGGITLYINGQICSDYTVIMRIMGANMREYAENGSKNVYTGIHASNE